MHNNKLAAYAQAMSTHGWTLTRLPGNPGIHMYKILDGKNIRATFDEVAKGKVTFRHHSLRYMKKNTQSQLRSIELQYSSTNNKSTLFAFVKALNLSGFIKEIVLPKNHKHFVEVNKTYKGGLNQAELLVELDRVINAGI